MNQNEQYISLIKESASEMLPISTGMESSGVLDVDIDCVMFDVYGTLFISGSGDISLAEKEGGREEAVGRLLEKYGYTEREPSAVMSSFFANIKRRHRELKKEGVEKPEVRIEEVWKRTLNIQDDGRAKLFALEYELAVNPVYPMPDLWKVLDELKGRGIPMGIISNAQYFTPILFEAFSGKPTEELGLNEGICFFSYQYEQAKPSVFLYEKAAQELKKIDRNAENTLYIGNDMLNDVAPAAECGFKTALFAGDKRSLRMREGDPRTAKVKADLTITKLEEILKYI